MRQAGQEFLESLPWPASPMEWIDGVGLLPNKHGVMIKVELQIAGFSLTVFTAEAGSIDDHTFLFRDYITMPPGKIVTIRTTVDPVGWIQKVDVHETGSDPFTPDESEVEALCKAIDSYMSSWVRITLP